MFSKSLKEESSIVPIDRHSHLIEFCCYLLQQYNPHFLSQSFLQKKLEQGAIKHITGTSFLNWDFILFCVLWLILFIEQSIVFSNANKRYDTYQHVQRDSFLS